MVRRYGGNNLCEGTSQEPETGGRNKLYSQLTYCADTPPIIFSVSFKEKSYKYLNVEN